MQNIGLILEGGGMRGVFTAGVLDFFLDAGLTGFSNCIGVSAGACHACSFLAGQRGRAYRVNVDYLDDKRYCSFHSLITTGDIFGADMLYNLIPNQLDPIDNEAFLRNPTTFQAVVTNCATGRAEYPYVRDLKRDVRFVQASSSLPLLSRMVEIDGQQYLDGGISDAIPLGQSIAQGCEKNVVVLTRDRTYHKGPSASSALTRLRYARYPALAAQLLRRHKDYEAARKLVFQEERAGRAIVLAPTLPLGLSRLEKDKAKLQAAYDAGYALAQSREADLRSFLSGGQ